MNEVVLESAVTGDKRRAQFERWAEKCLERCLEDFQGSLDKSASFVRCVNSMADRLERAYNLGKSEAT